MSGEKAWAYLLIAHGTREEEGKEAFFRFVEEFRKVFPGRHIQPSFLELAEPTIAQGIGACIRKGAQEIVVLPLMFFPGRHVNRDIPNQIQEAKRRFPQVDFHYAGALALTSGPGRGTHELPVFDLLLKKIAHFGAVSKIDGIPK